MSERVTVEELKRVLDTLEQAAEDHASADRTVASDDIGVAVDALERAADTIAALERERDEAQEFIREATTIITGAMGGGSENFVSDRNGGFRIDPHEVARRFNGLREDRHRAWQKFTELELKQLRGGE